jgi:hypothetical protein
MTTATLTWPSVFCCVLAWPTLTCREQVTQNRGCGIQEKASKISLGQAFAQVGFILARNSIHASLPATE